MTTTWRATNGLKQAIAIVNQIETELVAELGFDIAGRSELAMIGRHRMIEVLAKALDQALADGAEQGAMERATTAVASFTTASTTGTYSAHFTNGNGHANPDDYSELPVMAKGWEASADAKNWVPVPLDDHMPDAPAVFESTGDPLASVAFMPLPYKEPEAPKKRRGRPPGSKAKAAKPAKKRKSAKAKDDAMAPGWVNRALKGEVDAPVAETVAATVTEQGEAPVA